MGLWLSSSPICLWSYPSHGRDSIQTSNACMEHLNSTWLSLQGLQSLVRAEGWGERPTCMPVIMQGGATDFCFLVLVFWKEKGFFFSVGVVGGGFEQEAQLRSSVIFWIGKGKVTQEGGVTQQRQSLLWSPLMCPRLL